MPDNAMSSESTPSPEGGQTGRTSVWLLATLSLFGLIGFVVAFGLIIARTAPSPHAAPGAGTPPLATARPGPQGERGPAGPPGARGPAGDPGIRVVRMDCSTGNCTLGCDEDEVILTAHCGAGRPQASFPNERSALCRSQSRAKVEIVAACLKAPTQQ